MVFFRFDLLLIIYKKLKLFFVLNLVCDSA